MPRPKTKEELINYSDENYEKMWNIIDSLSEEEFTTEFDFSSLGKKEAHWQRDKNVKDILIHLYEWHQLLLNWVSANKKGEKRAFLPGEYTFKTISDMNDGFTKKYEGTSFEEAKQMLSSSHKEIINLVKSFTDEELFTKKYFDWTGSTSLGSYCVSSLSSHYDWAIKKLKAHKKVVKNKTQ